MSIARIMLIAEPPAGPTIRDHLNKYADTLLVRTKDYSTVHAGTEWVFILNGGPRGNLIFDAAMKVGAHAVAVPASWSQMQAILDRIGFFTAMAPPAVHAAATLTHRPLAGLLAPLHAPAPLVASSAAPAPPLTNAQHMAAMTAVRVEQSQHKIQILRDMFTKNPEVSTHDAQSALRALSPDGAGVANGAVVTIRREIRTAKGLAVDPPHVRGPRRKRGAVQPTTPPVTSVAPARPVLPPDVDAAARLLKDALEASAGVLEFTLAYRKGSITRVAWQPLNTATLDL